MEKLELPHTTGGNVKWYSRFRKQSGSSKKKKLNVELFHDPEIPLLGIHPNEMKTNVHTKTCTWISQQHPS